MTERREDKLDKKLIEDMEWEGCPNNQPSKLLRISEFNLRTNVLLEHLVRIKLPKND